MSQFLTNPNNYSCKNLFVNETIISLIKGWETIPETLMVDLFLLMVNY